MTDLETLKDLVVAVVEGVSGEEFHGPVKIREGDTSYAYARAIGLDGHTELSEYHLDAGFDTAVLTGFHELHHHIYLGDIGNQPAREDHADSFAEEQMQRITEKAFSPDVSSLVIADDWEEALKKASCNQIPGLVHLLTLETFDGLQPLSLEDKAKRYEQALIVIGEGRIDSDIASQAGQLLARKDRVSRFIVDETVLDTHPFARQWEADRLFFERSFRNPHPRFDDDV